MVSKEQLVQTTESSISSLVTAFRTTPYLFYTENDLHCFLYRELLDGMPFEDWRCETKDNRLSILLHKEYPTKTRYRAKTFEENVDKAKRGHFDLSIWNPDKTRERLLRVDRSTDFMREQQTLVAVEFDLIEGNASLKDALHHFRWDLLKLSPKNEVEHGYQLVFVRNWIHRNDFLAKARTEAAKAKNATVLYIETNNGISQVGTLSPKRFLNYKSMFN